MGTRSLTKIIETYTDKEGKTTKTKLLCTYRQYDGYPSGHGQELAEFLNSGSLVNGIGMDDIRKVFNGMGCLAAQFVSEFKEGAGGFYIYPFNSKDCGEEYLYEVYGDFNAKELRLVVKEVGYYSERADKYINKTKVLFDGTPADFLASEVVNQ